jgi:hypothetical protein
MPSPFPGMAPYIERPELWIGFHNTLASVIQEQLNALIVPRYFAAIEPRVTYETVEIEQVQERWPDVAVTHPLPPLIGWAGSS